MLPSRRNLGREDFVKEFLATLTPGVIDRASFIDWQAIDDKLAGLEEGVEFYVQLRARLAEGAQFVREVTDSLLAADQPANLVQCAFELLGHTQADFTTRQDDIHVPELIGRIRAGDECAARGLAQVLRDLGFERILEREAVDDIAMGVQIGLETHRRKNVGGEAFHQQLRSVLDEATQELALNGLAVRVEPETKIAYEGGSKRVDFAVFHQDKRRVAIEGNFYTTSGSKPTEIRRSYADVSRRLEAMGVVLVWVTDGTGYRKMRRSLADAFDAFPNIYNLRMARKSLADDLAWLLA